jgi:polysaccharide export outer membrane protein
VEDLLPGEIELAIAQALKDAQLILDPAVTVHIVEYHSRPISVAGAVRRPITFQAVGRVTLLDAINRAEGLSPDAGSEVLVSRSQTDAGGQSITLTQRISVKGLIADADPELNVLLTGGEEIRVPETGKVYVVGNVRKPGAFRVAGAEDTTVLKILAVAEGLAPYAGKTAYIYRVDAESGKKNEIPIELGKIMSRKVPDVPLREEDILYIPDNSHKRATMGALEKIVGFGAATASGVLIWGRAR